MLSKLIDFLKRVRTWNIKAGQLDPDNWVEDWVGNPEARDLAVTMVEEEVLEMNEATSRLRDAVDRDAMDPDDPWIEVEILDAACDIFVTVSGVLSKAGLVDYFPESLEEVLRSNDTKLIDPVVHPNGKIGKNPMYYEEPDIKTILMRRR